MRDDYQPKANVDMALDDMYPGLRFSTPPLNDDHALQRLSDGASKSVLGLLDYVFQDIKQLARVMPDAGLKGRFRVICSNGLRRTYFGCIVASGFAYKVFLTAKTPSHLTFDNIELVEVPDSVDPDAFEAMFQAIQDAADNWNDQTPTQGN